MDYKELQNDKIKASLIKVEALQKEYEVTLQQYQEAGKNYINTLQTTNTDTIDFTALQGRAWWGTGGVNEGTVTTQQECETMCANSANCSGATFNPVKRYCWTRTGDGSLSAGLDSDYALIPKQKAALIVMTTLNDKLLDLNQQISSEVTNINPDVQKQFDNKNVKHQQLNASYQQLMEQKMEMEKQLQEYYSIEEENENQSLYANQQTVSMRFWVLITCVILLITLIIMFGLGINSIVIIWLIIIIILIILTFSLSSPSGFIMWFILLIAIILMKTGNLPSP